jgi:biotin carboxylase
MTKPILVIGGRPRTMTFASEVGPAVNLQHPALVSPATPPDTVQLYLDYTDLNILTRVGRALHHEFNFATVLSVTEPGSVPAALLRTELDLPGHKLAVARTLQDKLAMRAALSGQPGLVEVPAAAVGSAADVERFAQQHGYPIIIKPVDGTASVGVYAVDGPAAVADVLGQLADLRDAEDRRYREFFRFDRYMAETMVGGPEFSVECFSFAGEHVVIGVTEKVTTAGFVEVGHIFPARCDDATYKSLSDAAVQTLQAIGITDGPSHTELKLTERGPAVIESHDRGGGDGIVDLVRLATGFDMEWATVAWAAGKIDSSAAKVSVRNGAATAFASAGAGLVTSVTDPAEILAMPYVTDCEIEVAVGSIITGGNGNWDRAGQVICVAPDSATAADAAQQAAAAISIGLKDGA